MIVLFNKPYDVLSQFTDSDGRNNLSNYINIKELYPAGRLDKDSEGLLVLTDDGRLQHAISHPKHKLIKTYWVQLDRQIDESALKILAKGVQLKDGMTAPAVVKSIPAPQIWPREPPVRYRVKIPTSWIEISISEGRNRQIRRMTAAVGFPTLRLIRAAIGPWPLGCLQPGTYKEIEFNIAQFPSEWRKILRSTYNNRHHTPTRNKRYGKSTAKARSNKTSRNNNH